jgi:hypothetical protein
MSIWRCLECGGVTGGSVGAPRCSPCGSFSVVRWEPEQLLQTTISTTVQPCPSCAAKDAELADLKARTCATCCHRSTFNRVDYCERTTIHYNQSQRCDLFGNVCGGWEPRP